MPAGRNPSPGQSAAQRAHAAAENLRYSKMSAQAKRALIKNRDREAQQAAGRRHAATPGRQAAHRASDAADRLSGAHAKERTARAVVATAKATGRLKDPGKCQSCGKPGHTEAHHPDHDKPLEVQHLCPTCHGETRQAD